MDNYITCGNGEAIDTENIPVVSEDIFRSFLESEIKDSRNHLSALFASGDWGSKKIFGVISDSSESVLKVSSFVPGEKYQTFTDISPRTHLFEREIFETHRILPSGHKWLKPVRFPDGGIGEMVFFSDKGDEIHEVGVGPVHAGVIEPGHFRFQCYGEIVRHLEISLGYQHRGIEKKLKDVSPDKRIHLIETASGDATAAHSIAYCRVVEGLSSCVVPSYSSAVRAAALELERIACHIGDIGALSGDVGFLPTSSLCGKLRGDVLNLTALICGNRFSRNLVLPGGVGFDINGEIRDRILEFLERIRISAEDTIALLFNTPSVLSRFEGTGFVSMETAFDFGLTGPSARGSGIKRDVRCDFSDGIYRDRKVPVSVCSSGDVLGRALVRRLETEKSFRFVKELLESLPEKVSSSDIITSSPPLSKGRVSFSLTEGWRGEVVHIGMTDSEGKLADYKITDPSFSNWPALSYAMRGEGISDFPLCNKSFNLSYCGFDL